MRLFTLTASLSESYLSFCDGEEGERERGSTIFCLRLSLSLSGRSQETGSLRQGGRELRLAGRLSLSPPCAAQPMLLTRGLKVESFATAPPPPPRSLLPNHLHPPSHPLHDHHHPALSSKLPCSLLEKQNKTKTKLVSRLPK